MLKVGIIGAGSITKTQLDSFSKNKNVQVVAIADINESLAREKAEIYAIPNYYSDYKRILEDEDIDAVSIATPTFTHCAITVEALKAGKDVLCEKPPALSVKEVELAVKTAHETGKLLMWELPCRFMQQIQFLKKHIDSGNMGNIIHAEACRINRYSAIGGWFADKEKAGGGMLIDATIHQIDEIMYLMGYPKVKTIVGISTDVNNDLAGKLKGRDSGWISADTNTYDRTVESMASGYVTFDNGASLYIKSSAIMYSVKEGTYIDLIGSNGGARLDNNDLTLLSNMYDYMVDSKANIYTSNNMYDDAINHFVDCCTSNTKCICEDWQGIELMKIIEGIYQSAETGKPIIYE